MTPPSAQRGKVWLVNVGRHIDQQLFGVFSTKELAEEAVVRAFRKDRDDIDIDEWNLDQPLF